MSRGVLPTNVQAEQVILGALLDPEHEVYPQISGILQREHFADPVHGFLYGKITDRVEHGYLASDLMIEVENDGLTPEMEEVLTEVGGSQYLRQLQSAAKAGRVPVIEYAESVVHAYWGRAIIEAAEEAHDQTERLLSAAFNGSSTAESLADVLAALEQLKSANRQMDGADVQFVDGHVVDMRHPDDRIKPDLPMDSDIYGQPMLLDTSLDREEVLILSEFHHAASKRAVVLVRAAERDHHRRRGTLFSDALLELDPMDPPLPGGPDRAPWEID
jgi:DnaB-like helicase N terminal domain